MQLADSGIYTCVARSRAGLAELNFDVQVQGTNTPSPFDAYTTDLKELYLCVLIYVYLSLCQCLQVWSLWSQSQWCGGPW